MHTTQTDFLFYEEVSSFNRNCVWVIKKVIEKVLLKNNGTVFLLTTTSFVIIN